MSLDFMSVDDEIAFLLSPTRAQVEARKRPPGAVPLAAPSILRIPKVTRLNHDFETYCELDLTDVGVDAYSRHDSCEILMCAYAVNYDDVKQWVPAEAELMPAELEDPLLDERVIKTAWNKSFEWHIWKNVYGLLIPHEQWRCTMALSYSLALPGSLDTAGVVVDIPEDKRKQAEGRTLIRTFCQPRKPSKNKPWTRTKWFMEPEKWHAFKGYNRADVRAEQAILRKLLRFDMPDDEWELWIIDQIINERGIPINMAAVDAAMRLYTHVFNGRAARLKELTGLANPNSTQQLLPWLQDHGYVFDDCKKGHIARELENVTESIEQDGETRARAELQEALTIRSETARSSPKKYFAIDRCVDRVASVLRNAFQFAGAGRTWRWAGRMVQVQNLPRPEKAFEKIMDMVVRHLETLDADAIELIYDNPFDLLASCIRSMVQAPPGHLLYDADLNAIENRVLGWIAREKKILRVFKLGRDPYIDFATYMYHQPYDALYHEYKVEGSSTKRQISKPAVLGCGYQLGPGEQHYNHTTGELESTGLLGYAANMRVKLTKEQAVLAVKVFRETYSEVVDAWYGLEKALKRTVRTGLPSEFNMLRFEINAPFVQMVLPKGRRLSYCRPRIEPVKTPWGEWRDSVTYEGMNDKNQWIRISTHGGKIMENADQAIARDLLAHGMKLAHKRGLDLRLHVHDQLVGVAQFSVAEDHLKILEECMNDEPEWGTYKGMTLPLATAGSVSRIWKKD